MVGKVIHYTEAEKHKVLIGKNSWFRLLIGREDGAPNYAMRVFEIEEGGYIQNHKHPWEHEIFVLEGEGEVKIGDKWVRVSSGHAILIPPNVEHEYRNVGRSVWRFVCIIPHPRE